MNNRKGDWSLYLAVAICAASAWALSQMGCSASVEPSTVTEKPYLVLSSEADSRVEPILQEWASRWSVATGLDIELAENGIPVSLTSDPIFNVTDPTVELCGGTFLSRGIAQWIKLDSRGRSSCADWSQILGHEMGHAIERSQRHSAYGVLGDPLEKTSPVKIDPDSLILVCETAPCTEFNPEIP